MMKALRYTEYLYLFVAIAAIYKIVTLWDSGENLYLFIFFAVISIGMFIFRRTYRKKFEKRQQDNERN